MWAWTMEGASRGLHLSSQCNRSFISPPAALFHPDPSTSQLPLEQDLTELRTWTFRLWGQTLAWRLTGSFCPPHAWLPASQKGWGAGHCSHPSLSCPRPISSISGPHPISESAMTNPHMNPHCLQNKVQKSNR